MEIHCSVFFFLSTFCLFSFSYVMGNFSTNLLQHWCRGKMLCYDQRVPGSNPFFKQKRRHYHDNLYQGSLSWFLSQVWTQPKWCFIFLKFESEHVFKDVIFSPIWGWMFLNKAGYTTRHKSRLLGRGGKLVVTHQHTNSDIPSYTKRIKKNASFYIANFNYFAMLKSKKNCGLWSLWAQSHLSSFIQSGARNC